MARNMWIGAAALLLLVAAPAQAASGVRDAGEFFTPETEAKAGALVQEIQQRFDREVLIDTVATVPAEKRNEVQAMDREARARFFHEWARTRAKEAKVDGIYVLICKEPSRIEVLVGNKTGQRAFLPAQRQQLQDRLLAGFRTREYDATLIQGLGFVRDTMSQNLKAMTDGKQRQPGASPIAKERGANDAPNWGSWILIGLVALLGFWLLTGLLRAMSGGAGMGGGGGFLGGLMTGLFGAMIGSWIYSSFFSDWGSQAHAGEPTSSGYEDGHDQDYSGSGGDFDDYGGGDYGGGDFGGDF